MESFTSYGDFHAWRDLTPIEGSCTVFIARQPYWFDDSTGRLYLIREVAA